MDIGEQTLTLTHLKHAAGPGSKFWLCLPMGILDSLVCSDWLKILNSQLGKVKSHLLRGQYTGWEYSDSQTLV